MATNIKIKDGPRELKRSAYHYGGYLDVWTKDGYRKYQARAAIKELVKLYEEKGQTTFRLVLVDGLSFTAEANSAVFSQMVGDQKLGTQPGDFPIIPGAKPPSAFHGDDAKGLIGILVLIGIVWMLFGGGDSASPPDSPSAAVVQSTFKDDTFSKHVMVKTICTMAVEEQLRSPSSADFPWTMTVSGSGTTFFINSYVEAKNAFNATIKTPFYCEVTLTGSDINERSSWKISKLQL